MSETRLPRDLAAWVREASREGPDLILFRVRRDQLRNPRNGQALDALILQAPDWVNVVALTPAREMVLVRQYRFGTERLTDEIPGGVVHPGEESRRAAERELREETGYSAPRWTYLGAVEANPAFLDNVCHHWLAEEAVLTHPLQLDDGEDIAPFTLPLAEVRARLRRGEIRHSLVVTALSRVLDLRHDAAS